MPDQPKILVIQTAFIGDVILVTPLFSALKQRFPQAWIECLTTPAAGDVLRNNPHVNRLIAYDKHDSQKGLAGLIRLMQQLKHSQYHVVLVVVCLPEFKACEISCVSTLALGNRVLIKVLLPEPDGPSTKVVLPCSTRVNNSFCAREALVSTLACASIDLGFKANEINS